MNNFLTLTKVFFLSGFNVNKKKKSQKSTFQLLATFGLLFLALSTYYNFTYFKIALETGYELKKYMIIVLQVDAMLVFMTTLFQMQGTIFKTKDYEFLESIPVKKSTIVLSKISGVYLIGLAEDLILTLPAIVLYIIYTSDIFFALITLIATIFVAIIPLLASSLLGSLIALITSKLKHQNIFTIILYLVLFSSIFIISMLSSSSSGGIDKLFNLLPYFQLVYLTTNISTIYYFAIFIAIHIVSLVIIVFFISKIYRPMNSYLGSAKVHEEYKSTTKDINMSVDKALYKKELAMVVKNPKYAVNSFLGPFLFLFMGVFFLILPNSIIGEGSIPTEDTYLVKSILGGVIVAMGIMCNSIVSSASASISLEASNFHLLASYPIEIKQIVKNKLKVAIVIPTILNASASIIIIIVNTIINSFDLVFSLELLILPIITNIGTAIISMLCGLRWPKLEFENEMQALKNSASVSLSMLFCFLPCFLLMAIVIISSGANFAIIGFVVSLIYYGLEILIAKSILKKKQEKLFIRALSL